MGQKFGGPWWRLSALNLAVRLPGPLRGQRRQPTGVPPAGQGGRSRGEQEVRRGPVMPSLSFSFPSNVTPDSPPPWSGDRLSSPLAWLKGCRNSREAPQDEQNGGEAASSRRADPFGPEVSLFLTQASQLPAVLPVVFRSLSFHPADSFRAAASYPPAPAGSPTPPIPSHAPPPFGGCVPRAALSAAAVPHLALSMP